MFILIIIVTITNMIIITTFIKQILTLSPPSSELLLSHKVLHNSKLFWKSQSMLTPPKISAKSSAIWSQQWFDWEVLAIWKWTICRTRFLNRFTRIRPPNVWIATRPGRRSHISFQGLESEWRVSFCFIYNDLITMITVIVMRMRLLTMRGGWWSPNEIFTMSTEDRLSEEPLKEPVVLLL